MAQYTNEIIKAIQDVNINALYYYKKILILYDHKNTISNTIHSISSIKWYQCKDKFLNMIKYVCRTFSEIILQNSLLEFACEKNFLEFAKLIIIINKRNKVNIEYDFNKCFKASLLYINKDIIEWINSINEDNIYNINYENSVQFALNNYPENYLRILAVLKDNSIIIDNEILFKKIYQKKYIQLNDIKALSIISDNNKFDISIYIDCYIESISKLSGELYLWCIDYFTKNNYNIKDIDIGNVNELFISTFDKNPEFGSIFADHNEIDISYNDYYAFFKVCNTYYVKWIVNKYNIPDEILIEGFKYMITNIKLEYNYNYLYKYIKNRNILTLFDDIDDIINDLRYNNPTILYWICKQTDKYIMYFNKETKIHEIIKNNGIYHIINNIDKYIETNQEYECDICMNDNITHYVKLECKHTYCKNCTIKLYKCPMCLSKINSNITLLISNKN